MSEKVLDLSKLEPVNAYVLFLKPFGHWVGHAVLTWLLGFGKQTLPIAHVALLLEFHYREENTPTFFVVDYGWNGITVHEWEPGDGAFFDHTIQVVDISKMGMFHPLWMMNVISVLYYGNIKARVWDFIQYPFTKNKPLVCTGFIQLVLGESVTNPTPEEFLKWTKIKRFQGNSAQSVHNMEETPTETTL